MNKKLTGSFKTVVKELVTTSSGEINLGLTGSVLVCGCDVTKKDSTQKYEGHIFYWGTNWYARCKNNDATNGNAPGNTTMTVTIKYID